jgi:hypothetical protein
MEDLKIIGRGCPRAALAARPGRERPGMPALPFLLLAANGFLPRGRFAAAARPHQPNVWAKAVSSGVERGFRSGD